MKKTKKATTELVYEIKELHGFLNDEHTKLVATVSWNNREPKIDIRKCWMKDGELALGSGISLSNTEIESLKTILASDEINGKAPVDFDAIFDKAGNIIEKRGAGYTTKDGFITLNYRPGFDPKKAIRKKKDGD